MDAAHSPQADTISRLLDGYQHAAVLIAVARLKLADAIPDTPAEVGIIAAATGLHEASLRRLLRVMTRMELCMQDRAGRYALTETGHQLRSTPPGSLYHKAMLIDDQYYETWRHLDYSLRTGRCAFDAVHGQSVWEHRERNAQAAAHFQGWLGPLTARHARQLAPGIGRKLEALDVHTVADLGGGAGRLLAELLRLHPAMQGILVDLPEAVRIAASTMQEAGVASRCRLVEANFFDAVPVKADAYLLKSILHDWDDDQATLLLQRLRTSLGMNSRLFVIERTLDAGGDMPLDVLMLDLRMLLVTGGRERSAEEYKALLADARFHVRGTADTAAGFTIFEATAA